MADTTEVARPTAGVSIWQRLVGRTTRLRERRTRRRLYRSTLRDLLALSDDELSRRGLHPGDIHAAAWRTAHGA